MSTKKEEISKEKAQTTAIVKPMNDDDSTMIRNIANLLYSANCDIREE